MKVLINDEIIDEVIKTITFMYESGYMPYAFIKYVFEQLSHATNENVSYFWYSLSQQDINIMKIFCTVLYNRSDWIKQSQQGG